MLSSRAKRGPRLLILGMLGEFTFHTVETLCRHRLPPCAIITAAKSFRNRQQKASRTLPTITNAPGTLGALSKKFSIPLHHLEEWDEADCLELITRHQPEMIAVACFPHHLSLAIRQAAPLGCYNLHPSLLPAYRGPMPLFWQFRQGEKRFGVTLHIVDESFDDGDIVMQEAIEVPDGITGEQINQRLALLAGQMLVQALDRLGVEATTPLAGTPQDPAQASYFSYPQAQDFHISRQWPAQRVFNFMRGTAHWRQAYPMQVGEEMLYLKEALGFSLDGELPEAYAQRGDVIWVQFTPGILRSHAYL